MLVQRCSLGRIAPVDSGPIISPDRIQGGIFVWAVMTYSKSSPQALSKSYNIVMFLFYEAKNFKSFRLASKEIKFLKRYSVLGCLWSLQ